MKGYTLWFLVTFIKFTWLALFPSTCRRLLPTWYHLRDMMSGCHAPWKPGQHTHLHTLSLPVCLLFQFQEVLLAWRTFVHIAKVFKYTSVWRVSRYSLTPLPRPKNGTIILYNRKKVKYRKDGYCWKKRKDGKTTREDHMKLKVQGMEVSTAPCYYDDTALQWLHYWWLRDTLLLLYCHCSFSSCPDHHRKQSSALMFTFPPYPW